jgi:hypothetical protein
MMIVIAEGGKPIGDSFSSLTSAGKTLKPATQGDRGTLGRGLGLKGDLPAATKDPISLSQSCV